MFLRLLMAGLAGNVFAGLRLTRRTLLVLSCLLSATTTIAATNVIEYTFDAAGNITNIARQAAPGFAITSFSPVSGFEGTPVTIYGTGFSATPASNVVKFNGTTATVSASTTGSISTTVPTGATTGTISVTVGASTVTSAQSFTVVIPPTPTIASFTPTAGAATVSVSVTGTDFITGATTVKLNGVTASATVASATSLSFTVPASAASGKITATTAGGTATSDADFIVPPSGINAADIVVNRRVTVDGASVNLANGTPNKHVMALFEGALNGYYSIQLSTFETSPTTASVPYKVMKPDNTVLVSGTLGNGQVPSIHLPKLATAGTYSIVLSPGTATLNTDVRVTTSPVLTVDGPAIATTLDFAYQSARFVFDATAGQHLGIGGVGVAFTPSAPATSATLKVTKPDASTPDTASCPSSETNCAANVTATVSGTYFLTVESQPGSYSNLTVQLNSEATGTLTPDTTQDVSLARVGQDARYAFTAAVGDSFAINVSAFVPLPASQTVKATVVKSDGTTLVSCSNFAPATGLFCELGVFATAGTYYVYIDPVFGMYGTFKLTLKQGALLTTSDTPAAFAPASTPESARFRFSATAGQNLSVGVFDIAHAGTTGSSPVTVYRPNGSSFTSASCSPSIGNGRCKLTLSSLPVTGTYSVAVTPSSGVKVSGSLNISSDVTGTLVAGTPQSINADRAGQNARLTFTGTAGDITPIKLSGITTSPANQNIDVSIWRPDGGFLTSTSVGVTASGVTFNFAPLPSSGTYTVLIEPKYGFTWQGQVAIDGGTLMTIDGSTVSLSTSAAGETLRYRFSGTTGQRLEFGLAGLTYASSSSNTTALTLYRPDGNTISMPTCSTSGAAACETFVTSLPSTGVYSLVFSPPMASTITGGTVALSTPATGSLVIGDPAQTIAITRPGQTARYTFSGTSAQLLRLNWSGTTVASGATVSVSVLKPDGSTLSSGSFVNASTSGFDIASLPSSGTYTVVFDPNLAATMSAPVTLVTR